MRRAKGNIFNYKYLVVPTNMQVKNNGLAVMGAGIAKEATRQYPNIQKAYGTWLKGEHARTPFLFEAEEQDVILLPTKNDWRNPSNIEFVTRSIEMLSTFPIAGLQALIVDEEKVAVPPLGCGRGGLSPVNIYPIMSKLLDDRFILVEI